MAKLDRCGHDSRVALSKRRWLLASVAVVALLGASLGVVAWLIFGGRPKWSRGDVIGTIAIAVAIGGGIGAVIGPPLFERWLAMRSPAAPDEDLPSIVGTGSLLRPPRVVEVDPFELGVAALKAPVVSSSFSPRPYVARDIDNDLDAALRGGAMTIVIGAAAAGKTRTVFEAARRVYPERRLLAPKSAPLIGFMPELLRRNSELRDSVIWLDDLETYLRPDGLTTDVLHTLLRVHPPVAIVATMRLGEWEAYTSREDVASSVREVLRRAHPVFIAPHLSPAELDRFARLYARDESDLLSKVERYGLGPYFVGAPDLIARLMGGESVRHPGAALVHAAADWRRIGMLRPIPRVVLDELRHCYPANDRPREATFDEALAWALQPVRVQLSLIESVPGDTSSDSTYDVPTFIVEEIQKKCLRIPEQIWKAAISSATGFEASRLGWSAISYLGQRGANLARSAFAVADADGIEVGAVGLAFAAQLQGDEAGEEGILTSAAERGNAKAATVLGRILHRRGEMTAAEGYLRQAAASGDEDGTVALAALQAEKGEYRAAEALLTPLEAVHPRASFVLGLMDYKRGNMADARRRAQAAAQAGFPGAAGLMGALAEHAGQRAEADGWYTEGANRGDPEAQVTLASHLMDTDKAEARRWLRIAQEAGHPEAAHLLGDIAAKDGKMLLAVKYWRAASERGSSGASLHLGYYLADHGNPKEAESLLRHAARRGNLGAAHRVGVLLNDTGSQGEGENWLRRAATRGNHEAACSLGSLLLERGDDAEGKLWLHNALDQGHLHAGARLGAYLVEHELNDEAEAILTRSATAGDRESAGRLAALLERRGRRKDAERWYRRAIEQGDEVARAGLGQLITRHLPVLRVPVYGTPREREGRRLLTEAAQAGDGVAMNALGIYLDARRRYEDARDYWAEAARHGVPEAALNLGNHLIAHGRKADGEQWLRQAAEEGYGPARTRLIRLLEEQGRWRAANCYREPDVAARWERSRGDEHARVPYSISFRPRAATD